MPNFKCGCDIQYVALIDGINCVLVYSCKSSGLKKNFGVTLFILHQHCYVTENNSEGSPFHTLMG